MEHLKGGNELAKYTVQSSADSGGVIVNLPFGASKLEVTNLANLYGPAPTITVNIGDIEPAVEPGETYTYEGAPVTQVILYTSSGTGSVEIHASTTDQPATGGGGIPKSFLMVNDNVERDDLNLPVGAIVFNGASMSFQWYNFAESWEEWTPPVPAPADGDTSSYQPMGLIKAWSDVDSAWQLLTPTVIKGISTEDRDALIIGMPMVGLSMPVNAIILNLTENKLQRWDGSGWVNITLT